MYHHQDSIGSKVQTLLNVGENERALEVMKEHICNKRSSLYKDRSQKSDYYEEIMKQYLTLCVQQKNAQYAKEGLWHYRSVMQQVNAKSLEDIFEYFIRLAEEECDKVEASSLLKDIEDLESAQVDDEELLISALSVSAPASKNEELTNGDADGESKQSNEKDSAMTKHHLHHKYMVPIVRFRWEVYRHCLELLKNNRNLEALYHRIVRKAFQFCVKYQRKGEFKKLSKTLHEHILLVKRFEQQPHSVKLAEKPSFKAHLEDRLLQLDFALEMSLWPEAFRAIDDIWRQLVPSLKTLTLPYATLEPFCKKAAAVFWLSKNPLFHSAIFHKILQINRLRSGRSLAAAAAQAAMSEENAAANRELYNQVVVSTLAVSLESIEQTFSPLMKNDMNVSPYERHADSSHLFQLPFIPTRSALVEEIKRKDFLRQADPCIARLFQTLEPTANESFERLDPVYDQVDLARLNKVVKEAIAFLESHPALEQYVPNIKEIAVARGLSTVAACYDAVRISDLQKRYFDFVTEDQLIAVVLQRRRLERRGATAPVAIDQRRRCLIFGGANLNRGAAGNSTTVNETNASSSVDLQTASRVLQWAAMKVTYDRRNDKQQRGRSTSEQRRRNELIDNFRKFQEDSAVIFTERRLQQQAQIDEQKRYNHQMNVRQEEKRMHQHKRKASEERRRQEMLKSKRQEDNQEDSMKIVEHNKREQLIAGCPELAQFPALSIEDLEKKQREILDKRVRERQDKLKSLERNVDYFVRAKRIYEAQLLRSTDAVAARKVSDKEQFETSVARYIEQCKADVKMKEDHRTRFSRMLPRREEFIAELKNSRREEYEKAMVEFKQRLVQERAIRLAERQRKRDEEQRLEQEAKEKEQREKAAQEASKVMAQRNALMKEEDERRRDAFVPPSTRPTIRLLPATSSAAPPVAQPVAANAAGVAPRINLAGASTAVPTATGATTYVPPAKRQQPPAGAPPVVAPARFAQLAGGASSGPTPVERVAPPAPSRWGQSPSLGGASAGAPASTQGNSRFNALAGSDGAPAKPSGYAQAAGAGSVPADDHAPQPARRWGTIIGDDARNPSPPIQKPPQPPTAQPQKRGGRFDF